MAKTTLEEIRLMMKDGDIDEAQSFLAQMLIDNPKDEAAWLLLADIVPPDQAKDSLERVLEVNPDNNEARLRLAQLTIPLPQAPPEEEIAPVNRTLPTGATQGKSPAGEEDLDLEALIRSLEEKEGLLATSEAESLDHPPEEASGSDEALLAELLQGDQSEPLPVDEHISVDEQSFALPGETAVPEQSNQVSAPEIDLSIPAMASESYAEEMPQVAAQDFSTAEEKRLPEVKRGKKQKKKGRRGKGTGAALVTILIFLCILTTTLSSWYYFYGPCGVENVIAADKALSGITSRWDESMMVATNSSRIVLAEPLRRLVEIRQELNRLDVPACMTPAHESLDRSMLYTLEAYDKLFNYENDVEISKRFNMAKTQRKQFELLLDYVRQCAPLFCQ